MHACKCGMAIIIRVGYTIVWSGIYDDLTAGVGVSYGPLSHSRHNGEV